MLGTVALSLTKIVVRGQEGEDFEAAAEAYVKRFLEKGVPSLFADMKPLYRYIYHPRMSAHERSS